MLRFNSSAYHAACFIIASALALGLSGCRMGADYKRPVLNVPGQYRAAQAPDIASASDLSLAEGEWPSIFTDSALRKLIREALRNNQDLRIAAQRVLEAQAQVGIVRSQGLPTVSAGGSFNALQLPQGLALYQANGTTNDFIRGGGFSGAAAWNLDFWGLYRRQTEAARAELLGTVWAQRATRVTLVQDVANAYFALRGLDSELEITKNTIKARQDSLDLTRSLEDFGAGSRADTRQAEELLHTAQANLPEIRRQIVVEENTISVLLGHAPEDIERGVKIEDQPHPLAIPVGLPSQLLERRPDIQQAEATLIAANARVGAARARFFPQISLSGSGGSASNQLNSIFAAGNTYWIAAGSVSQPIFAGGRIRSTYRYTQAQRQEMVETYQKTILTALKDVSDSLVSYSESRNRTEEQRKTVVAALDAVELAKLRYSGGNTSYVEVLATSTDLYDAQLRLAQSQAQQAASLVQLYGALGGGWK